MTNNEAATVVEYRATRRVILSINTKFSGTLMAIFNKNPKRIPEKVLSSALSFNIVSYRWTSLSSTSCELSSLDKVNLFYLQWYKVHIDYDFSLSNSVRFTFDSLKINRHKCRLFLNMIILWTPGY